MLINGVEIEDTFAEAFQMTGDCFLITARNEKWALEAARKVTGFATSVIACGCKTGIEEGVKEDETPDGRPGVNVLLFTMGPKGMEKQLLDRVGQCIMTCPTTACFNNLESEEKLKIGGKLRYFGDGFQISKLLEGKRLWRVPVMEGEFLVEESFGIKQAIGGGNFLILVENPEITLKATEQAVEAMEKVRGTIMPFPGGIVRRGSKTSSRYKFLKASTNTAFCPTIKRLVESQILGEVNSVLEIVIDGLSEEAIREAKMDEVRLILKAGMKNIPVEAETIRPDIFTGKSHEEIEALPLYQGNREVPLGELFEVRGERASRIRLSGDLSHIKKIGWGMKEGRIIIQGNVGMHFGADMRDGEILVEGDASDWLGGEMKGGLISPVNG
ncbi:Formylmethanofuran--tetrahydromethanopterin formyltransferase [subsurface metagenome]